MSNASVLGAVLYADEASFGDSSVTTFDERLPVIQEVDVSGLEWSKQDLAVAMQYQNDGVQDVRMPKGGSFTISLHLTGHGSATTGSITANQLETFLGRVIGNVDVTQDGTTLNGAGTDEDTFTATSGAGILDGGLIRIGALGDGDGEGQFYAVTSETTNTVELATAMAGTGADSAVVYAPALIYPNEGPTATTLTSMRFQFLTANGHYNAWGCYPTSVSFTGMGPGELPRVDVTMACATWNKTSGTFPTATSADRYAPAPVAAGSLFRQTKGTTTRSTLSIREFNLNIDFQTVPLLGHGATDAHQVVVGARRIKCQASFDMVVDKEATGTETAFDRWNTAANSASFEHVLYTMSAGADGMCVGIYFPKVKMVDRAPIQTSIDGLNRERLMYRAITDSAGADDLRKANFILALA